MKQLIAETEINAPSDVVWKILMDFSAYPEWNPFVVSLEGEAEVGSRLKVKLRPPESRATTMRPKVTALEEGAVFEWLGHLGFAGVFDGRHGFEIESSGERTRFIQREEFTGILVPLLAKWLDKGIKSGFELMNSALKDRAEELAHKRI